MIFLGKLKKGLDFFWENLGILFGSERDARQERVETIEKAVVQLQAQFKYLQQRVDKMEVPR